MTYRFVLDQNFPTPLMKAARPALGGLDLRHTFEIDPRLSELDDWELILAVHHHREEFVGIVTADRRMLGQARELAVLQQTGISLVVAEGSGHDPVKAAGLVLTHIGQISSQLTPGKSQIWSLASQGPRPQRPVDYVGKLAAKLGRSTAETLREAEIDNEMLSRDPLTQRRGAR